MWLVVRIVCAVCMAVVVYMVCAAWVVRVVCMACVVSIVRVVCIVSVGLDMVEWRDQQENRIHKSAGEGHCQGEHCLSEENVTGASETVHFSSRFPKVARSLRNAIGALVLRGRVLCSHHVSWGLHEACHIVRGVGGLRRLNVHKAHTTPPE